MSCILLSKGEMLMNEEIIRAMEQRYLEEMLKEMDQLHKDPPPPLPDRPTIHYTELPEDTSDSPIAGDWNLYRREVGRLLAEGHEKRWVLIKGEVIIGIWDTEEEARAVALHKYLMQPCLIQRVRSREPIVRMSARFWACQS